MIDSFPKVMAFIWSPTVAFLLLLCVGCGGGEVADTGSDVAGIVTAKMAPTGTIDCENQFEQASGTCGEDITYKITIEPLPGEKYTAPGWYSIVATVCIAPSEWRRIKLGDEWVGGHGYSDLWCDG